MSKLGEYACIFVVIARRIFLRMRTISDKNYRGNQHTHFMFNNFFPQNSALCDISKSRVERGR